MKRKTLNILAMGITVFFSNCSSTLHLSTSVAPNKSLVIGDSIHSAFEAKLINSSKSQLEVSERIGSEKSNVRTLKPGDKLLVEAGKGSEVLISNKSEKESQISVNIRTVDNSPVRNRIEEDK